MWSSGVRGYRNRTGNEQPISESTKNSPWIGGRNLPDTIQRNHWLSLVPDTKAAQQLLIKELSALAMNIIPAMEQLLSECTELGIEHPERRSCAQH